MPTLYGLPHCGTCQKAIAWLDAHQVEHQFIDYRAQPIEAGLLLQAAAALGWEKLVNRASTTWRGLPEALKSPSSDAEWLALATAHPTLIRRPLLVDGERFQSGFRESAYQVYAATGSSAA